MTDPSIQELLRELVLKLCPALVLAGVHRYTVARDNGDGRFDLNPGPGLLHPPRLRVEQWAAPGVEGGLVVGHEVAVVFLDNDEALPAIIGHLPLRRGKPESFKIDCTGTLRIGASASAVELADAVAPVVRYGEKVLVTGAVVPGGPGGTVEGTISFSVIPNPPPFATTSKVKA